LCNAWNHPVDCRCGFGGDGHLGRRGKNDIIDFLTAIRGRRYESYVNPNARCPVCGALVFYYVSPDGGRVFFDELGPPWPKHSCTDHPLSSSSSSPRTANEPAWRRGGWLPFAVESVVKVDPNVIQLNGKIKEKEQVLHINARDVTAWKGKPVRLDYSLIQVRPKEKDGQYELSILTSRLNVRHCTAFESRLELRANTPKGRLFVPKSRKKRGKHGRT